MASGFSLVGCLMLYIGICFRSLLPPMSWSALQGVGFMSSCTNGPIVHHVADSDVVVMVVGEQVILR